MINLILNHSKLIVGICVILFGIATIPVSLMIIDTSETNIDKANIFDYFIWFTGCVVLLSGVLFALFGTSIIEDYARNKSYR
tara:strand:- start:842 stop:1087 length:246 start_codon:yes stop_codon:yes gene_type:complete